MELIETKTVVELQGVFKEVINEGSFVDLYLFKDRLAGNLLLGTMEQEILLGDEYEVLASLRGRRVAKQDGSFFYINGLHVESISKVNNNKKY